MIFNAHSRLAGLHAFLSPSNHHWVNYTEDKLDRVFFTNEAAKRGTELHALAHDLIRLGVKLPKTRATLNMYVNDAIGFRMKSEQTLYYSENCFGHADTIAFRNKKLRIHDLKTGTTKTSVRQLEVYASIFCLEYGFKPFEIETELRIYQNDEVQIYDADPDSIMHIMEIIVSFDRRITELRMEAAE